MLGCHLLLPIYFRFGSIRTRFYTSGDRTNLCAGCLPPLLSLAVTQTFCETGSGFDDKMCRMAYATNRDRAHYFSVIS
jgi:hypothetical protein